MSIGKTTELTSVSSSQIVDGAVTSAKIGTGAVVSASIAAGAVGSAAISAGAINSTHIGANAVVSGDIAAGAVDSAALASGAVVSASIAAGAVGSAALAANAVVAAKIAASAVGVVAISSGTSTSGTLLTADGAGGVSFSPAPGGGGMVLISSVSAFASASPTYNLSFIGIPQTYTRLHLIGQFYVTSAGEHYININPSTNSAAIGGTTGFASSIEYINKTTDGGITTYGNGNNNMEGTAGSAFICTIPNQQSRWSMVNMEINNYRGLGPTSRVGFLSQQHAGKYVGHGWGGSEANNGPIRTLWVSGSFHIATFRLYGS